MTRISKRLNGTREEKKDENIISFLSQKPTHHSNVLNLAEYRAKIKNSKRIGTSLEGLDYEKNINRDKFDSLDN